MTEKFNKRFGNEDIPYTIRRQLQEVKNWDETIEKFAEKIQEMATDGYGAEAPEYFVEITCIDAFLRGCTDKKAVDFITERNPTTIDLALQCVKSSIHNQRIICGKKTEYVKRVKFESDDESNVGTSNLAVRVLNRQDKRFLYELLQTP